MKNVLEICLKKPMLMNNIYADSHEDSLLANAVITAISQYLVMVHILMKNLTVTHLKKHV